MEEIPVPSQSPAASPARRKSKRRSSFVLGRKQPCYPSHGSPGLARNIAASLPDSERLAQLSKATIEYALEKLSSENPDVDGWQQFKVEATDQMNSVVHELEDKGAFKAATEKSGYSQNPVNNQTEQNIKELSDLVDRLKSESKIWDDLVEEQTAQADEAERLATALKADPAPIEPDPELLTEEQKAFLKQGEDLNASRSQLDQLRKKSVLAVHQLERVGKLLTTFGSTASTVIKNEAHTLYLLNQVDNSPRTLIANAAKS